MEANLSCLGIDSFFPALGKVYVNNEGFRFSEFMSGPLASDKLNLFKPRDDDVFVISFPKTGSTWMKEIVYLIGSDLDFETAKSKHLSQRCPFLDYTGTKLPSQPLEELKSPRILKLHSPYSSLPKSIIEKRCKLIYPMRNPKDTLVSYYHFCVKNKGIGYTADFATFFNLFLEGKVLYGPYWKHCLEFWNRSHEDNIFITTFEDMKKDLPTVVRNVSEFMGKNLTEDEIKAISMHCGFEAMRNNPCTNPDMIPNSEDLFVFDDNKTPVFLRKGEVGDWKNYFTEEMNKKMDEHIDQHFTSAGMNFVYEL